MANTIDWGKIYCDMIDNSAWGADSNYTAGESVPDFSAPTCWTLVPAFTSDTNTYRASTTLFTADATQIS